MAKKMNLWKLAVILGLFLLSQNGHAQITSQYVNPNVMMVIDSSGSMDWLDGSSPDANAAWYEGKRACFEANDIATSEKRTSWQVLQNVLMGEITSDDFHCFYEESRNRPNLTYGFIKSMKAISGEGALTESSIYDRVIGPNTSEYREGKPHYRAVSCYDPRDATNPSDRGDWNADKGQCIGNLVELQNRFGPYTIMATGHVCLDFFDHDGDGVDEINYISADSASGTPEMCINLHPLAKRRETNGILERYRTLARFGIMTYDNMPAPAVLSGTLPNPHEGLWNYGQSRKWACKKWSEDDATAAACTWNAGARAENSLAVGGLVSISDDMETTNKDVQTVLNTVEPLNCSPMGSLLDDVGYYFTNDSRVLPAGNGGSDLYYPCRPRVVLYITDGSPTQAFEFPEGYCGETDDMELEKVDGGVDRYPCPWNSSKKEVEGLRQKVDDILTQAYPGYDSKVTLDPIYVVVIGLNMLIEEGEPPIDCTPEWNAFTQECILPEGNNNSECVQVKLAKTEATCQKEAFLSTRDFLNELALAGWPNDNKRPRPWTHEFCERDDTVECGGSSADDRGALFVKSAQELGAVIDMVLSNLSAAVSTRTELVATSQTEEFMGLGAGGFDTSNDSSAMYEFNSGFEPQSGLPWKGYLYRQGYSCTQDGTGGGKTDEPTRYHQLLTDQSSRTLFSIGEIPQEDAYNSTTIVEGFNVTDFSDLSDCDVSDHQTCQSKTLIVDELSKFLKGDPGSGREENKLADIYNSTPSILSPPKERLTLASYNTFRKKSAVIDAALNDISEPTPYTLFERPPYLYVGTSDGVLHSFYTWASAEPEENEPRPEVWGYVPHTMLKTIGGQFPIEVVEEKDPASGDVVSYTVENNGVHQHYFGVDGPVVTADLRLFSNPESDSTDESNWWRSVVMGGFGKGAQGYYCLDVTHPQAEPKYRWEISPRASGNNDSSAFEDSTGTFGIGVTMARPGLAYVKINSAVAATDNPNAVVHEEAVAILPGGYFNDENGGQEVSSSAYVVRAADGKLLKELSTQTSLCSKTASLLSSKPNERVAQLLGEPAIPVGHNSVVVTDEAYIGDDRGRIWRMDLHDEDPEKWCLDLFFDTLLSKHYQYKDCDASAGCCGGNHTVVTDECSSSEIDVHAWQDDDWAIDACTGHACASVDHPYPRIPIVAAPTIVRDDNGRNVILFGTGQIDGLERLDHNRVFSLTEKIEYEVDDENNVTQTKEAVVNWWVGEPIPNVLPSGITWVEPWSTWNTQMKDIQDAEDSDVATIIKEDFELGEKMLGMPIVFEETAYFTTFSPITSENPAKDACFGSGSRIWGVKYNSATEFGQLVLDSNDPETKSVYTRVDENGEPLGLLTGINVIRRPACSGAAEFAVVAQKSNPAAEPGAEQTGTPKVVTAAPIKAYSQSGGFPPVLVDSWTLVFD